MRQRHIMVALTVLFAVAFAAFAGVALLQQRARILGVTAFTAQNGATFAAAYTGRTYEVAAQSLREASDYIAREHPSHEQLRAYLAAQAARTSLDDYTILTDAQGKLLLSSDRQDAPPVSFADRPWFRLTAGGQDMVVGAVLRSRVSHEVVWTLSKRLTDPEGRFTGALAIGVRAVGVQPTAARNPIAPQATVWARDGRLLAATFADFGPDGQVAAQGGPPPQLAATAPSLSLKGAQITATSPVPNWPLVSVVSFDKAGVLAEWRREVFGTVIAFLMVLAGGLLLVRQGLRSERRERQAADGLRLVLESVTDGFYSLAPDWRIVVFNRAAEEFFGRRRGEVLGKVFWDVFPAAGTEIERQFRRVQDSGEPARFQFSSTAVPGRTVEMRAACRSDGGLAVTFTDVTERARAEAAQAASEEMLRSITDAMPVLISYVDAGHVFRFANRAYEERFQRPLQDIVGRRVEEVFAPDAYEARRPFVERALAGEHVRYEVDFPRAADLRHTVVEHIPHVGPDGRVAGFYTLVQDITEQKESEERLRLLAREVDHRANNLLTVVQGSISLTRADTVEGYREALLGRVAALARAHQLLAASRWTGADLRTLVQDELRPYEGSRRIDVLGEDIALAPATAQALSLAIHELATNAVKHGALSAQEGVLSVSWHVEGEVCRLLWRERGGPAAQPPRRRGVGMQVLERALKGPIGGGAELDWAPEGLTCRMAFRAGSA